MYFYPYFLPKVLPSKHWLHPLLCECRGAGGGELLYGSLQISQLCPGLSDSQAGYEPHQGRNSYNHPSLVTSYNVFRLWTISREVGQSGLMRDSWNNLEYLRGSQDIRDFMPFVICSVMSYQVTWIVTPKYLPLSILDQSCLTSLYCVRILYDIVVELLINPLL